LVGARFVGPAEPAIVGVAPAAVDSWSESADRAAIGPKVKDEVGADIFEMSAPLR